MQHVALSEREQTIGSLAGNTVHVWEFDFREDLQGIVLYYQTWQEGQWSEPEAIIYGMANGTERLCVAIDSNSQQNVDSWSWATNWARMMSGVEVPLKKGTAYGTVFLGETAETPIALEASEDYLLAMRCYDYTAGQALQAMQEDNAEYHDAAMLLRLKCFATAEEAEAAANEL